MKQPKSRLWGWLYELEHFNRRIIYQPGEQQPADSLSRILIENPNGKDISEEDPFRLYDKATVPRDEAPSAEVISRSTGETSMDCSEGHAEEAGEHLLTCKSNLMTNEHICLNTFDVEGVTYSDKDWPILCGRLLKNQPIPSELDHGFDVEFLNDELEKFTFKGNTLCRIIKANDKTFCVPFIMSTHRLEKIKTFHEALGHMAVKAVLDILKTRYWWPSQKDDVISYINSCRKCQLHKNESQEKAPLHPLEPAPLPFERWAIDFIQDLPISRDGNTQIITCMDYATRWVVAKAVPNRAGRTVLKFFYDEIVSNYGIPQSIITDRASYFLGGEFGQYIKNNGIRHLATSAYHPRTNGMIERMHRILKDMLTKFCDGNLELWDGYLKKALMALRFRVHTVTKQSPFFLLYGIAPRIPGDPENPVQFDFTKANDLQSYTNRELTELGQERAVSYRRSLEQATRMKGDRNESLEEIFDIGTYVKRINYGKTSLKYRFTGPYIVIEVLENSLYKLMLPNGEMLNVPVHQDDLRVYASRDVQKFYSGNKMIDMNEGENETEAEDVSLSREGGVVMIYNESEGLDERLG
jgi:hypothetical protein